MKKLMIAAAAVAMTAGAFAACSWVAPDPVILGDSAWAYKWKFSGKTTKAVATDCVNSPVNVKYITRTSTSLKIEGWSLYCDPACGDFEAMEADEIFWQNKPAKVGFSDASGVTLEVANVIGKKGKEYEAAGSATFEDYTGIYAYDLVFAGLGKYDAKNARVASIKGNFAGIAAAPQMKAGKDTDCVIAPTVISKVWECCGCPTLDADSVAFGKWSVKYNKSIAKKYGNNKLTYKSLWPSWAK